MAGKGENMPTWELAVPNDGGRAEVADPSILQGFNLALSEAVADQIKKLEESVFTAEQRLGTFLVG